MCGEVGWCDVGCGYVVECGFCEWFCVVELVCEGVWCVVFCVVVECVCEIVVVLLVGGLFG